MDSAILTRLYSISQHPKVSQLSSNQLLQLTSNLELRTSLYQLLSTLSYHNPQICDLMLQLGFLNQLFKELNNHQYIVEQANYDQFSGDDDQIDGNELSDDEYEAPVKQRAEEANNITFRKSTTQMITGPDEILVGKQMNLRNIMEDPDQYGFDKSRLVNG